MQIMKTGRTTDVSTVRLALQEGKRCTLLPENPVTVCGDISEKKAAGE